MTPEELREAQADLDRLITDETRRVADLDRELEKPLANDATVRQAATMRTANKEAEDRGLGFFASLFQGGISAPSVTEMDMVDQEQMFPDNVRSILTEDQALKYNQTREQFMARIEELKKDRPYRLDLPFRDEEDLDFETLMKPEELSAWMHKFETLPTSAWMQPQDMVEAQQMYIWSNALKGKIKASEAKILDQGVERLRLFRNGWTKEMVDEEFGGAERDPVVDPISFIAGLGVPFVQKALGSGAFRLLDKSATKAQASKLLRFELAQSVAADAMATGMIWTADEILDFGPVVSIMSGIFGGVAGSTLFTFSYMGLRTWIHQVRTQNPRMAQKLGAELAELNDAFSTTVKQFLHEPSFSNARAVKDLEAANQAVGLQVETPRMVKDAIAAVQEQDVIAQAKLAKIIAQEDNAAELRYLLGTDMWDGTVGGLIDTSKAKRFARVLPQNMVQMPKNTVGRGLNNAGLVQQMMGPEIMWDTHAKVQQGIAHTIKTRLLPNREYIHGTDTITLKPGQVKLGLKRFLLSPSTFFGDIADELVTQPSLNALESRRMKASVNRTINQIFDSGISKKQKEQLSRLIYESDDQEFVFKVTADGLVDKNNVPLTRDPELIDRYYAYRMLDDHLGNVLNEAQARSSRAKGHRWWTEGEGQVVKASTLGNGQLDSFGNKWTNKLKKNGGMVIELADGRRRVLDPAEALAVTDIPQGARVFKRRVGHMARIYQDPWVIVKVEETGETLQESIAHAATRHPTTGEIFTGRIHLESAEKAGLLSPGAKQLSPEEFEKLQGFTTNTGRFVTRKEAITLAKEADQVPQDFTFLEARDIDPETPIKRKTRSVSRITATRVETGPTYRQVDDRIRELEKTAAPTVQYVAMKKNNVLTSFDSAKSRKANDFFRNLTDDQKDEFRQALLDLGLPLDDVDNVEASIYLRNVRQSPFAKKRKEQRLKALGGVDDAPIEPADEALSRYANSVIDFSSTALYTANLNRAFQNAYQEVIDPKTGSIMNIRDLPGDAIPLRAEALAVRHQIDHISRIPTEWEMADARFWEGWAHKIYNKSWYRQHVGKALDKQLSKLLDNISLSKGIRSLRGLTAVAKLGLWAPAQMIVQSTAMLNASAHLFKYGGINDIAGGADDFITAAIGGGLLERVTGLKASPKAKELWDAMQASGFIADLDFQDLQTMYNGNLRRNSKFRKVVQAGLMPFKAGEAIQRGVIWMTERRRMIRAIQEGTAPFTKFEVDTQEFLDQVSENAYTFALNMQGIDQPRFARDLLAIPLQFKQFLVKQSELMWPGNAKLSRREKFGLMATWGGIFGMGGIPYMMDVMNFSDYAIAWLQNDPTQIGATREAFVGAFTDLGMDFLTTTGVVDETNKQEAAEAKAWLERFQLKGLINATDEDIDIATRAALGMVFNSYWYNSDPIDLAFGASSGIVKQFFRELGALASRTTGGTKDGDLVNLARILMTESDPDIMGSIISMSNEFSGPKNMLRAVDALRTGELRSGGSRKPMIGDPTLKEIILTGIGITPARAIRKREETNINVLTSRLFREWSNQKATEISKMYIDGNVESANALRDEYIRQLAEINPKMVPMFDSKVMTKMLDKVNPPETQMLIRGLNSMLPIDNLLRPALGE